MDDKSINGKRKQKPRQRNIRQTHRFAFHWPQESILTNRKPMTNLPFRLQNNVRNYNFADCLKHITKLGKSRFGLKFELHECDHNILYKLLCYAIRDEERCTELGMDINKGIILAGPVGCGKSAFMNLINEFNYPRQTLQNTINQRSSSFLQLRRLQIHQQHCWSLKTLLLWWFRSWTISKTHGKWMQHHGIYPFQALRPIQDTRNINPHYNKPQRRPSRINLWNKDSLPNARNVQPRCIFIRHPWQTKINVVLRKIALINTYFLHTCLPYNSLPLRGD